jgi:hypothetical protein
MRSGLDRFGGIGRAMDLRTSQEAEVSMVSKLSRAVVGLCLTGSVVGLTSGTAFASHKVKAASTASTSCSVSSASYGSIFTVTGSGYAAGGNYQVQISWPVGTTSQTGVTADSSGSISTWAYAYYYGTYTVTVGSPNQVLATCSMTVA